MLKKRWVDDRLASDMSERFRFYSLSSEAPFVDSRQLMCVRSCSSWLTRRAHNLEVQVSPRPSPVEYP